MSLALDVLALPFLACLVLTGIHAYLGLHVLARGVIFVDLALAQVAALGITVAYLAGHPIQSEAAYWYALAFALGGAALLAAVRPGRGGAVPPEAVIGIVYAVSAALVVLVVDRAPQGGEHIKQLLVGSILTVTPRDVLAVAGLYAAIGALHWAIRRPLLQLSFDPDAATRRPGARGWDFIFYASFAVVVTSSVRIAGVLLVFSYLVVPAAAGTLLARAVAGRLMVGWTAGLLGSALGLGASYLGDLPTGATVVASLGALLAATAGGLALRRLAARARVRGLVALRGLGIALAAAVALAGSLLAVFPRMDHHWLDAVEVVAPAVRLAFLTPFERTVEQESREAIHRGGVELQRLRALQREVQWGARSMSEELQERIRQFLASGGEIAAGDRMVLRTLRDKARERQRLVLGVPLAAAGATGAALVIRAGRAAARPSPERSADGGEPPPSTACRPRRRPGPPSSG